MKNRDSSFSISRFRFSVFTRIAFSIYSRCNTRGTKPRVRLSAETERGRACRNGRRRFRILPARPVGSTLFSTGILCISAAASYCAGKKCPVLFPWKRKFLYTEHTEFQYPAWLFLLLDVCCEFKKSVSQKNSIKKRKLSRFETKTRKLNKILSFRAFRETFAGSAKSSWLLRKL